MNDKNHEELAEAWGNDLIDAIIEKPYPRELTPDKLLFLAREIIRLREANERLHEKLGETIDECSALRHKLDKALDN